MAVAIAALFLVGKLVDDSPHASPSQAPELTTVHMAGGNPIFNPDQQVIQDLRAQHIDLQPGAPVGSREMCAIPGLLTNFDAGDSGSEQSTQCIQDLGKKAGKPVQVAPLWTGLMVIVTYKPIVALLTKLGIASVKNGITVFDVAKYLRVFASGERWSDIPGNTSYPNRSRILLWTTNPKQANSGGMFAAIAYAAQGNSGGAPESVGPSDRYVPVIRDLLTELGSLEPHSPFLLNKFLSSGMGEYPMAMVYESYYLSAVLHHTAQDPNLTVMYPTPDVEPDETVTSWTTDGGKLITALKSKQLTTDAEAYGYRTVADKADFVKYMKARGIDVPDLDNLANTLQFVPLPTEAVLEELINAVATSQPGPA
jgi:hypothetical protein